VNVVPSFGYQSVAAPAIGKPRRAARLGVWRLLLPMFGLLLPLLACAQGDAAATPVPPSGYTLGPGDEVNIQVFGEEDLSQKLKIASNGRMNFPFLGELNAAGLTTADLEKRIADGLRGDFLIDPKVSVTITDYRPFFVNGQVKSPGSFPFQPGLTVRKALSLAGGLTERASEKRINIISEGDKQRGRSKGRPVRMEDVVAPGDIITVDESFF
jgi:polysaccharide biosynthesis/export protein VpsN